MRIQFVLCLLISVLQAYGVHDTTRIKDLRNEAVVGFKPDIFRNIQLLEEALALAKKTNFSRKYIHDRIIFNLGEEYSRIGDFDRASELNNILIHYYTSIKDYENLAWAINNEAVVYNNKREYYKANLLFHKALQVVEENQIDYLLVDMYDGLSSTYTSLKKYDEAKRYLDLQASRIKLESGIGMDEIRLYFYFNQAEYYLALNRLDLAEVSYLQAIKLGTNLKNRKGTHAGIQLAKIYILQKRMDQARAQLEAVLRFYRSQSKGEDSDAYLLGALNLLAEISVKQNQFNNALVYVSEAEHLGDFLHLQYVFSNSKLFLDEVRRINLELGVSICFQLYKENGSILYLRKSLLYAEKAKANVLDERMMKAEILNQPRVSQHIKYQYVQLRSDLIKFEKNGSLNKASILRKSLDSLEASLGMKQSKIFDLAKLQANLETNSVVIQFFVCDSTTFVFEIEKNRISGFKTEYDEKSILLFYKILNNPNSSLSDFTLVGGNLYERYVKSLNHTHGSHLIFIPDKAFHFLVFDALPLPTSKAKNWGEVTFLSNQFLVSYEFSMQSMLQNPTEKSTLNYLGFAPDFSRNMSMSDLKYGNATVTRGQKSFGGKLFIGKDASFNNFRQHALHSNILQLYTHGVSSDSSYNASYLYFQDRKVFVDEVMAMPISTQLCLLTACEVGLGKAYSGEGLTGISWAFRTAGAQNIVQSLWKLNEGSSAQIINLFYNHLNKGKSSAEALRLAKQEYQHSPDIADRLKHPFYWAGMSHYGQGTAISAKKSEVLWWIFGGLGLIGLILVTIKVHGSN